ncbi:MAG TPA: hypothetical protein VNJ01_05410 [Bacteriovoracaceae bacterium]|nr:hypothetical protein [Bacteriovoracaceae bacterium]
MGLMYVFPVSEEEEGFAVRSEEGLTLKTYGLPYLFWVYALCSIAVILFMFLAIKAPVLKLVALGDETDATLGYGLLSLVGLLPVMILLFFFYEKRLVKKKALLRMEHRILGMRIFSEKLILDSSDELTVAPYLSSPNIAKIKAEADTVGFQNKGYFVLWLQHKSGKKILIDRHSRKADLDKLKSLLDGN